jgi:RNA polymerase sigma factor (sigma-70 family)
MIKTISQELVEAAQRGDAEALNAVLIHCQPDLQHFARKVCATPEDAEDAVQEALWIASRKIGTLRVASAFVGWLFRIVKNECYRLLRTDRLNGTAVSPLTSCDLDGQPTAQQSGFQEVPMREIVDAIANLSPLYRTVLIMRDVEDRSAPEVAQALNISVQAVKSRLHRARRMVRQRLKVWVD